MPINRVLFSSATGNWATPRKVYEVLNAEFHFTLDPCALGDEGGLFGKRDGLLESWEHHRVFINPPYGPGIVDWLRKAQEADLAVYLLPARTDTRWWHKYILKDAAEIRFIRGRLRFGNAKNRAPFPSVIIIFRRDKCE